MNASTLERPFGLELMTPIGEVINGMANTGTSQYSTTYVPHKNGGSTQVKDDDRDSD